MEEQGVPAAGTPEPERADKVVTLRPFDLADADAVLAWASDPVVTASMPWGASDHPCPARESLLALLRDGDSAPPHPWVRAVCLGSGGGAVVGAVAVTPTDDWCRAEIGVVLARARWSVALAAAAMRRAVAEVFVDGGAPRGGTLEGVERVEAVVDAGGDGEDASRRALEEAGFRREAVLRSYRAVEGQLRDMAIYSFISTDTLLLD